MIFHVIIKLVTIKHSSTINLKNTEECLLTQQLSAVPANPTPMSNSCVIPEQGQMGEDESNFSVPLNQDYLQREQIQPNIENSLHVSVHWEDSWPPW
jgi:hypothetical protein